MCMVVGSSHTWVVFNFADICRKHFCMKTTGVLYNHNKLLKLGKKIEIIVDTTFEITRRSSAYYYVTLFNKS
jgi:hypothetical protein